MNRIISIDILKRVSRRSIGLHITESGGLEVRAPYFVPHFLINQFVQSKRDWIIQTKKIIESRPKSNKIVYAEGGKINLAGSAFSFHITEGNAIILVGSKIFFPKKFLSKASWYMEIWCRAYAKKFLTQRLNIYAQKMDVSYKKISIRDTSSRWGSCSSSGTINFSYRLILADLPIIDYVVIHELVHITHRNHKKMFWDRVALFYPEYRSARAWLHHEGHVLRL